MGWGQLADRARAARRSGPALAQRLRRSTTPAIGRLVGPHRAIAALISVAAVTAVLLTLVATMTSASGDSGRMIRAASDPPPTGEPQPPHEPPRPRAAMPEPSPDGGGGGPGNPDRPRQPVDTTDEFVGWAILDRQTGEIVGSDTLADTSTTASMIKPWLVADYLRRTPDPQPRLADLSLIIRDSNNPLTNELFRDLGEHDSIARMVSVCGLTDSEVVPHSWSSTRLSARDTARMANCLADGRAAGPGEWTDWLLAEMRQVRGVGDFGIRDALPAGVRSGVAIKNGWVIRDEERAWHVSCLAVADGWAMGVLTRYPADRGYDEGGYLQGADICRSLAEQHLLPRLS